MDTSIRKVYRCGVITVLTLMLSAPVFGEPVYIPAKVFTPKPNVVIVASNDAPPIATQSIDIKPPVVVEKVGFDCFDLDPKAINCKDEKCCFDVVKGSLKGIETVTEPLVSIDKDYKGTDSYESIVFNYRTDAYAQSVVNLSNRIQMVMLNDSYSDGDRRAAIKLLRENHDKYVFELYNR